MKQCFGYVRVSTLKQGEGVSLDAQRAAIEQFAERNGIAIIQWFEEKQTAAKSGRPVFGAMLKALRRGKAAGVVMHKIDRSARNFADWAKIGDLADAGIDVHFAAETLDFRSRGGRLSADIQAVIAADYIRNLRDEIRKGIDGQLAQGIYPFGAPIGYCDNGGGKLKSADPLRAHHIREMFTLYASGQHSIHSLRIEMARRGLRNASGKPLTKTGIETVLNNPFYCGIIRIKRRGTTHRGAHEPLIPAALFQRVQEVKQGKSGKKVTRHNHLFRGLFRCGHCNAALSPERQKGHVYYRCQTRECPTKCLREEDIDVAVRETLSATSMTDRQIAVAADRVEAWFAAGRDKDAEKAIELQLLQLDSRLESLTDALIERLIDNDTYCARKEGLTVEKAQLEERQRDLQVQEGHPRVVRRFLELLKCLANNYLFADPAEKREMIEIMISNRQVFGKSVSLEPANWLITARAAATVLSCAHHRATSRTERGIQVNELVRLAEAQRPQLEKVMVKRLPVAPSDDEPKRDERGRFVA